MHLKTLIEEGANLYQALLLYVMPAFPNDAIRYNLFLLNEGNSEAEKPDETPT